MTTYDKLLNKAVKLVDKLQYNITSGKVRICENYGQKEISKFIDKELNTNDLTYAEKCDIKEALYKVSSIS